MEIKRFSDNSFLEYDRGRFDDFCVYYTDARGERTPPTDVSYFETMRELAARNTRGQLYRDFVRVYELVGDAVAEADLDEITRIAAGYGVDALQADVLFTILYMAMVAEERKEGAILGKRIKRLGVYQLLIENKSPAEAAEASRGVRWQVLDALCRRRGF